MSGQRPWLFHLCAFILLFKLHRLHHLAQGGFAHHDGYHAVLFSQLISRAHQVHEFLDRGRGKYQTAVIAVAAAAPAAIGATSEDPKAFGKALIFVALGEGIALYGLLVSILILAKI